MAFRPSIPNIAQPVTDQNGNITKIWWDFLLNLVEKTGGDTADIPGVAEDDTSGLLTAATAVAAARKQIKDTDALLASLPRTPKSTRRSILQALKINAPSRSVYVDVNGSDDVGDGTFLNPFATIEKGVTFANEVTNFDVAVLVGQGTYVVDNPFELPNNTFLIGWDTLGFFPTPMNAAALFTVGTTDPDAEVVFGNMRVNMQGFTNSAVRQDGVDSRVFATGCSMRDLGAVGWDCRNGFMNLNDMESSELDTNEIVYKVSAGGSMTVGRNTAIDSAITTLFLCDGATLNVVGPTILDVGASTVGAAIDIDNGGTCTFQNGLIRGATTGLTVDNASDIELVSTNISGGTTVLNVVDTASTVRFIGSKLDKNKILFPAGFTNENMLFQDDTEDEESTKILGDFFIGRPERGTVFCTGEGEPSTRGMMVLTTDGTATATTEGGNITDVTTEASSFSGSTFSFQGVTANHTILIASTLPTTDGLDVIKHPGEFILQETAAVEVTPRSFIYEYWDGAAWSEITVMSIEDDSSYRYGNEVFIRANSREHIRYNNDISADWTKKTINGGNYFWSRIRIATTVTTAPVFQQFRIHANFGEFATDGYARYYGRARFRTTLLAAGNIYSETGGIANFDLPIGNGGLPTGWTHRGNNQQFNGNGDAIYMQFVLPRGICTASSMRVSMYYIPEQAGPAGDASFIISALPMESQGIMVADPAGGSVPVSRALANTVAITTNAGQATTIATPVGDNTRVQKIESDPIDISDYYEGDIMFLRIEMDDDGPDNRDVFALSVEVNAVQWALGERLA